MYTSVHTHTHTHTHTCMRVGHSPGNIAKRILETISVQYSRLVDPQTMYLPPLCHKAKVHLPDCIEVSLVAEDYDWELWEEGKGKEGGRCDKGRGRRRGGDRRKKGRERGREKERGRRRKEEKDRERKEKRKEEGGRRKEEKDRERKEKRKERGRRKKPTHLHPCSWWRFFVWVSGQGRRKPLRESRTPE